MNVIVRGVGYMVAVWCLLDGMEIVGPPARLMDCGMWTMVLVVRLIAFCGRGGGLGSVRVC